MDLCCVTVEFEAAQSLSYISVDRKTYFAFAFAGWRVDQDKPEVSGAVQLVDRPDRSTGGPSICALVKDWRGPSMKQQKRRHTEQTRWYNNDDAYIYIYIIYIYVYPRSLSFAGDQNLGRDGVG